jgi:RNA polymerase sigma factor (sigma-70 family)
MVISSQRADATDEKLIALIRDRKRSDRARQRATQACELLYGRYARRLLTYLAARAKPHEVEDIHQAVWSKVLENPPQIFYGGRFGAWVFRIAHNLLIDQSRRIRTESLDAHDPVALGEVGPEERLIRQERDELLEWSLAKLDSQVIALLRARMAGESYEAISRRLGISKDAAYQRVYQAKKALRAMMENALG